MKTHNLTYRGKVYRKSSHSPFGQKCVGVSIDEHMVSVINTNRKDSIVSFTLEEWKAFILGAKDGEFDVGD